MVNAGVSQLSEGQRACLRRVLMHQSSKDIARELNISPHTVDQRLRVAMQHLGVTTRVAAAKILAEHEHPHPYQPQLYQGPHLESQPITAETNDARECGEQPQDAIHAKVPVEEQRSLPVYQPLPHGRVKWPFPLYDGEPNKLTLIERLSWICVIAVAAALAFGMILAGMDALSHLV